MARGRAEVGDVAVFTRLVGGVEVAIEGTVVEADASGRWVKVRVEGEATLTKINLAGLDERTSNALQGKPSPFSGVDRGYRNPGIY